MALDADQLDSTWPVLLEHGVARHRAGDLAAAEHLYRQVLEHLPSQPDAINLLGVIALQTGRVESAISLGRKACALDANDASYHLNLGNALRAARQLSAAATEFAAAVALRPSYAEAHNNLGLALGDQNRLDEAIEAFRRAVALQPSAAKIHNNLGSALRRAGRNDEADESCRKAIAAEPGFAPAHNNFANVLLELDETESAIASFREAIRLDPDYADAFANLCLAEYRAGNFDAAVTAGRTAIQLAPDLAAAHWNLSHTLLVLGDLAAGFAEYEWRIHCPPPVAPPPPPPGVERWIGQPLAGKTILLQAEQGLGDTIQFIRYARLLEDRGAKVILQCPQSLASLLRTVPGIAALANGTLTADFFCPLMSLPLRAGEYPNQIPYIAADPGLTAKWQALVGDQRDVLNVGLVWAGGPAYANDRKRSVPLSAMAPLAAVPCARFHSLQVGRAAGQIQSTQQLPIADHAQLIQDFADTAALIDHLDLVITVDTAVAHLAGAMGKPVWVLLPRVPDWRWMLDRADTPWYPTMRLFRQRRDGEWAPVIEAIVEELSRCRNIRRK
jgi:tetratricopeptide (TPR) repeat protein